MRHVPSSGATIAAFPTVESVFAAPVTIPEIREKKPKFLKTVLYKQDTCPTCRGVTDAVSIPIPPGPRRTPRPRIRRNVELIGGILLVVVTPVVAILPGPAGTMAFAGGMVLILRNSATARRRWARAKRRYPRVGGLIDRMMRRGSALRRHARDKALRQTASAN